MLMGIFLSSLKSRVIHRFLKVITSDCVHRISWIFMEGGAPSGPGCIYKPRHWCISCQNRQRRQAASRNCSSDLYFEDTGSNTE